MGDIATFDSIAHMKRTLADAGNHFFTPGAMAFFNSKIETKLEHGAYFVTSEYMDDPEAKKYTARYFIVTPAGNYEHHDIGGFQAFDTLPEARVAIAEHHMNLRRVKEVNEILGLKAGLWVGTDENDGEGILKRDDGEYVKGEAFGRGTTLERSGVRLYEGRDVEEIIVGDFATPARFGEYVRQHVDRLIERQG